MAWSGLYPWLLVLHVTSALAFLAVHGISMGVWWRLRRERDRAKLVTLLELSQGFITPMLLVGLALIVSGILLGVAAAWWFNGQWWLWTSIGLLVAIVLLMNPLVGVPLQMVRRGLCMPTMRDDKYGILAEPVDDAELDRLLRDPRPTAGATIGVVGIVLITWLMETKPF